MCLTLALLRATRTLLGRFINMSLMADCQLMAVTEVIIVYSKSKTIWNLYSENKIHFCSSLLVNQYHPPNYEVILRLGEKGAWEDVLQLLEERQARSFYHTV